MINWVEVYSAYFRFLIGVRSEEYSDATIRTIWMGFGGVPPLDGPELGEG